MRQRVGEAYLESCLQPSIKHGGGSIQVWGCITSEGVGDLIKIDEKLTAQKYKDILEEYAVPSGTRLIGNNFILQQDNDPKHTARLVKNYLTQLEEDGVLRTMVWPPQSPDMNIIEHVWVHLDQKRAERSPKNIRELWTVLQEEWQNIPLDFLQKLHNSLGDRILQVIKNKGGHTKY